MKQSVALLALLTLLPAAWPQGAKPKIERDVVYGKAGGIDLQLDLAVPQGKGRFPAVVCIHGGGWRFGHRRDLTKVIEELAGKGFVAATISYRLSDKAPFPAQIEDCKTAVRWLRGHAEKYQIDRHKIGCIGMSAGAHLACLLGTCRKEDGLEGNGGHADQSSQVQCVVSIFGPTDLSARTWTKQIEEALLVPFLGGTIDEKPEVYKKASPINYVHKGAPPFLFFHGTEDKIVAISQSRTMAEKLKAAGVDVKLVEFEGAGHGWLGDKLQQTVDQTIDFFDKHLKAQK
jgi:acetyl esterase/lipase